MAQVTVTIAGKIFRIACDDGQEPHLESLAHELDGRIGDMRKAFGEIGDNQLTVMAAISFLDEREDVKLRVAELEAERRAAVAATAASTASATVTSAASAAAAEAEEAAARVVRIGLVSSLVHRVGQNSKRMPPRMPCRLPSSAKSSPSYEPPM